VTALYLLPPVLSTLLLAAHFLRQGNLLAVAGLLALLPLLAVRRRWVPGVARLTLWLGAVVWLYTLVRFTAFRLRLDEPWLRMVLILGGVAVFTALSSLVFSAPVLRAWYRMPADASPDPAGTAEAED
jgi:hypothetical protein